MGNEPSTPTCGWSPRPRRTWNNPNPFRSPALRMPPPPSRERSRPVFIFLLQLRHMLGGHPEFYLFAVYSALIWVIWIVKVLMSRRYRPYTERVPRHDQRRRAGRRRAARPVPRRARPHGRAAAGRDHRRHQRRPQPGARRGVRGVRAAGPLGAHAHPRQAQRGHDRHQDVHRRDHRPGRLGHRLDRRTRCPSWSSRSPTSASAA